MASRTTCVRRGSPLVTETVIASTVATAGVRASPGVVGAHGPDAATAGLVGHGALTAGESVAAWTSQAPTTSL